MPSVCKVGLPAFFLSLANSAAEVSCSLQPCNVINTV